MFEPVTCGALNFRSLWGVSQGEILPNATKSVAVLIPAFRVIIRKAIF